ncbi:cadherin repeat domain-containing protein [Tenacibaculum sp. 47A_GOM-205m]|uniref:cadherin repeat domain-containing protein n=1 Tax=Tenacibaculum sp. 47A_GOM-205m TaxID=1380384 RepID=UPI00048A64F7|nr:cadherin repeat domain-containing protein [Tenacibaculum sp. 47A_GOM-205m]
MRIKNYVKVLPLALIMLTSCDKKEEEINIAPVIKNQVFHIPENTTSSQKFADVVATDVDEDELVFSIKENDANLFQISESGALSVAADKSLDYETKTSHKITVEVTDGDKSATAEITINITDVYENEAPVIESQTFTVAEDITYANLIGKVVATDSNAGTSLSFVIKEDTDNLFSLSAGGDLYLKEGKKLDYETKIEHKLTVEVSDGAMTASAEITIKVTDVVEDTVVNIPDANFKQALVRNNLINTNRDSEIQVSEAEAYSELLNVGGKNIGDLTGIEYFTNISALWAFDNKLTSVDLSKNVKLKKLAIYGNTLKNLDVSKNILLEELLIHYSGIENLNITTCTKLKKLVGYNNAITSINVANNVELEYIDLSDNNLTSIDVTQNVNLKSLVLRRNSISELDVTKNSLLELLYVRTNKLTSLNLNNNTELISLELLNNKLTSLDVSNNLKMIYLSCGANFLTSLSLSNNELLKTLKAANNQLTSVTFPTSSSLEGIYLSQNKLATIDVSKIDKLKVFRFTENSEITSIDLSKNPLLVDVIIYNNSKLEKVNLANGNNGNISSFNSQTCPNLTCIQVEARFLIDTTKWYKDDTASYSYTACP